MYSTVVQSTPDQLKELLQDESQAEAVVQNLRDVAAHPGTQSMSSYLSKVFAGMCYEAVEYFPIFFVSPLCEASAMALCHWVVWHARLCVTLV
jgi:hypothetical protein